MPAYFVKYAVPERLANLVCDAKRSALEWTLYDSMVSSFFNRKKKCDKD